ncbi:MAG: hypothetical protein NC453_23045 [Muribaculum sp.]|nr:hypothetical protein [Muribaculum sp.]
MSLDFRNLDLESFDFMKLSADDFREFLHAWSAYNGRLNRVSVADLTAEFELKNRYLLSGENLELAEIYTQEFVELLFQREAFDGGLGLLPFEKEQSREYRLWLEQKMKNKQLMLAAAAEGKEVGDKIDYSGYSMWRYNPVVFYKEGKKNRHRLLLIDQGESVSFLENREFAILSPVTYVGRTNSYRNARFLYAFGIDLDGVSMHEVRMLLRGMTTGAYPEANIIVNSGHGVHVYYLLERPIEMFATRLDALNKMKRGLTKIVWLVSKLGAERAQVQSVVQGFRVPGTKTKFGQTIRAYWNREAPMHTVEELNGFLGRSYGLTDDEVRQLTSKTPYNPSQVTLQEAKERWPEWYAFRVIGRKRVGKKWHINRSLYDWWLNILREGSKVEVHHRYWCILTLVVYGVKCGISRDEVERDALSLIPAFDRKTETVDNPFTEDDVNDAMRAFDEEYNKWPLRVIETTTGIRIDRNKRNGRKQDAHLRRARAVRDVACLENGKEKWTDGNGRKKGSVVSSNDSRCALIVKKWREENSTSNNKSLCSRETGLSRHTVHKWWNEQ